jgi:hypothetical protein
MWRRKRRRRRKRIHQSSLVSISSSTEGFLEVSKG